MMKKILFALLLCAIAAPAFAFDLGGYVGPVTFKFTDYTVGRQYTLVNGVWQAEGARSGLPGGAQNMADNVLDANGDGVEDSWGIIQATTIHAGVSTDDPIIWTSGDDGEYIKGMVYGWDDALVANAAAGQIVGQIGGSIDLYLGNLSINSNASPNNRATDPYNATEGTQFIRLLGVPGIVAGMPLTRYENVNGLTSPFTGDGSGYLMVDDGWGNYDWLLDGNMMNGVYPGADVFAHFDFSSGSTFPGGPQRQKLFDAYSNDPAVGMMSQVPEPASMILMGIGLLGAARLRRKQV